MSLLTALPTPNVWASRTQQASGSPGTQLAGLHSTSDRGPRARRPPGVEARPPTAAPPSTPSAGTGSPGRPRLRPTGYTRRVPATPSSENSGSTWLTHPFIGKRRTARDGGGRRGPGGPRAPEPLSPWSLGRVTLPACGPVPRPGSSRNPATQGFHGAAARHDRRKPRASGAARAPPPVRCVAPGGGAERPTLSSRGWFPGATGPRLPGLRLRADSGAAGLVPTVAGGSSRVRHAGSSWGFGSCAPGTGRSPCIRMSPKPNNKRPYT